MPAKGYKKGYVKDKDGKWVHPMSLEKTEEKKEQTKTKKKSKITVVKSKKVKDDLGPESKPVSDITEYSNVIITYKDARGKQCSITYVMAELELHESRDSSFDKAKKKTRIHLTIDGTVLEQL